ncbi:hypothetical protein AOQ84DRAFT_381249 [Glonium stellatum]|uniref:Uncharacterized protein n=1 Tax=Glonium stellatum TaxID=574774 RepID=A0A8E2ESC6_9PEZI|nr:hypothetical protein AOQ84DRAFT_381249 [Glonium stellatum]
MALEVSSSQQPAADWDETQCKAALAHLEKLQEQASLLPRCCRWPPDFDIVGRTTSYDPSHNTTSQDRAHDPGSILHGFKAAWQSQETQSILEHTKESQKADPDLSACVRVPKYGWVDILDNEKEAGAVEKGDQIAMLNNEEVDITGIVDAFKHEHPKFKVNIEADNQLINIMFRLPTLLMRFRVLRRKETNGNYKLDAECVGKMPLFPAITRCLASRPRPNDLKYLLDMIAAYTNTRRASCAKCTRLVDSSGMTPAARRSKRVESPEGASNLVWEALHERCL